MNNITPVHKSFSETDSYSVMKQCLMWDSCGAPKCPLDPSMEGRVAYPEEEKCSARLKTRLRIGHNPLPRMGMTKQEHGWYKGNPNYKEKIDRILKTLCIFFLLFLIRFITPLHHYPMLLLVTILPLCKTLPELIEESKKDYDKFDYSLKKGVTIVEIRRYLGKGITHQYNRPSLEYPVHLFLAYFIRLPHIVITFHNTMGCGTKGILKLTKRQHDFFMEFVEQKGIDGFPFTIAIWRYGSSDFPHYCFEILDEDDARRFRFTKLDSKLIQMIPKFKKKQETLNKRRDYEKKRKEVGWL